MIIFTLLVCSFQTKVASRGFHIYKNTTWKSVNIGQEISVSLETNEDYKKIDPYGFAIITMVSGRSETVGHIPREVSMHTSRRRRTCRWFCFVNELWSLTYP